MCQKLQDPFACITLFKPHNSMKRKHYVLHDINGKAKASILNKLGCENRTPISKGRTSMYLKSVTKYTVLRQGLSGPAAD